jgi:hypothetical protein
MAHPEDAAALVDPAGPTGADVDRQIVSQHVIKLNTSARSVSAAVTDTEVDLTNKADADAPAMEVATHANAAGAHPVSGVSNLQASLDAKAAAVHAHPYASMVLWDGTTETPITAGMVYVALAAGVAPPAGLNAGDVFVRPAV